MSEHPHQFQSDAWVDDVLEFWFGQLSPKQWFTVEAAVDFAIRERFKPLLDATAERVGAGDLGGSADRVLATVIVLDQFPRNVYRAEARQFAYDPLALGVAREAIARGVDQEIAPERRLFVYLPFEHSEDLEDQACAVRLIAALGNAEWTRFAEVHRDIIARFGEFPHRNALLGRKTTDEEAEFLAKEGRGF